MRASPSLRSPSHCSHLRRQCLKVAERKAQLDNVNSLILGSKLENEVIAVEDTPGTLSLPDDFMGGAKPLDDFGAASRRRRSIGEASHVARVPRGPTAKALGGGRRDEATSVSSGCGGALSTPPARSVRPKRSPTPNMKHASDDVVVRGGANAPAAASDPWVTIDSASWQWGIAPYEINKLSRVPSLILF